MVTLCTYEAVRVPLHGATHPTARCKIGTGALLLETLWTRVTICPSESCLHVNVYVAHSCVISIAYGRSLSVKGFDIPPVEYDQS